MKKQNDFDKLINSTKAVFTPSEIQGIVDIAKEHDLWIVSDEIYARLFG